MATKKNFSVNGHEYYRITRTIGHKTVDGKKVPIKKQFLGSSKRAAEKEYENWRDEQKEKKKSWLMIELSAKLPITLRKMYYL